MISSNRFPSTKTVIALLLSFSLTFGVAAPAVAGVTSPLFRLSKFKVYGARASKQGSSYFTDTPGSIDVGSDPLRDPIGRGLYSSSDITNLEFVSAVEAGTTPALPDPTYSPSNGTDPGDDTFFPSYYEQGAEQFQEILGLSNDAFEWATGKLPTLAGSLLKSNLHASQKNLGGNFAHTGSSSNSGHGVFDTSPSSKITEAGIELPVATSSPHVPFCTLDEPRDKAEPLQGSSGPKAGIGTPFRWEGGLRAGGSSAAPGYWNSQTGNLLTVMPLVSWSTPGGGSCGLTLYHNSQDSTDLGWGMNWRSNYDFYIVNVTQNGPKTTQQLAVCYPSGQRLIYTASGFNNILQNLYQPPTGFHDALTMIGVGSFLLRTSDQTSYYFSSLSGKGLSAGPSPQFYAYRLYKITDRYGNTTTISNAPATGTTPATTTITSPCGTLSLQSVTVGSWQGYTSVLAPGSRTWNIGSSVKNVYSVPAQLKSVTWPTISNTSPMESFSYNTSWAITNETAKDGNSFTHTYDSNNNLTSYTYPAPMEIIGGTVLSYGTYTFSYSGSNASQTDPFSAVMTDNYSSGTLRSHVDEGGYSDTYTWDSNANLSNYKDCRGYTTYYGYDGVGNMTKSQSPVQYGTSSTAFANGIYEAATYDQWNDLLTSTDSRGDVTT